MSPSASILLVTGETGGGHGAIAKALVEASESHHFVVAEMLRSGCALQRLMAGFYNALLRWAPNCYAPVFHLLNATRLDRAFYFQRRIVRDLIVSVEQEKSAAVLVVHPLLVAAAVSASRKLARRGVDLPVFVYVTDPFPPFLNGWGSREVSHTFVGSELAKEKIVGLSGVSPEAISVVGPCVRSAFQPVCPDEKRALRKRIGVKAESFLVLIQAGWAGGWESLNILKSLCEKRRDDVSFVFMSGRNEGLCQNAEEWVAARGEGFDICVLPFQENPEHWIRASDFVITKAGAATVFETLACGVPMAIDATRGILPQERGIAECVERQGLGSVVTAHAEWNEFLDALLSGGSVLTLWQENVRNLPNQNSASETVRRLSKML